MATAQVKTQVKNNKSLFDNIVSLSNSYAVFDLETTGLSSKTDKILEVCIKSVNGLNVKNSYHSFAKYEGYISPKITSINKITSAMVCDATDVDIVLNDVYLEFNDCVFVAHNSHEFDAKFLLESDKRFLDISFLDTRVLSKMVLPGCEKHSMSYLCNLLGINIVNQHTSQGDVDALIILFNKLSKLVDNPNDLNKCIRKGSTIK